MKRLWPFNRFNKNVKVELYMSNYVAKADLKGPTGMSNPAWK